MCTSNDEWNSYFDRKPTYGGRERHHDRGHVSHLSNWAFDADLHLFDQPDWGKTRNEDTVDNIKSDMCLTDARVSINE